MFDRRSNGAAENAVFGWFGVALAGTVGVAIGIALGFALSPSAGGSVADLTAQRDHLAAEKMALTGERDRLRRSNATLTAWKNQTERLPEHTKSQARDEQNCKSNDPQTSEWKLGREIGVAYGPSSAFGAFARRLEATKWWNPGSYWSLRGNVELVPEAKDLQIVDPATNTFAGRLSVCFEVENKAATPSFELDLEKIFWMGDKYSSTLQGAFGAIGRAMDLDGQEAQRVRQVAGLIPRVAPADAAQGMAAVVNSIPLSRRSVFSKKLNVLVQVVKDNRTDELLTSDVSEPAISFVLSKRFVATLCFGDFSKKKIPSVWSITITPNGKSERDPAWTQVDEAEMDSMRNGR